MNSLLRNGTTNLQIIHLLSPSFIFIYILYMSNILRFSKFISRVPRASGIFRNKISLIWFKNEFNLQNLSFGYEKRVKNKIFEPFSGFGWGCARTWSVLRGRPLPRIVDRNARLHRRVFTATPERFDGRRGFLNKNLFFGLIEQKNTLFLSFAFAFF